MSNYKCQICNNVFDESFTTSFRPVPSADNLSCPCCGSRILEITQNEAATVDVLNPYDYDWINEIESPVLITPEITLI